MNSNDPLIPRLRAEIEEWRRRVELMRQSSRGAIFETLVTQRADAFAECARLIDALLSAHEAPQSCANGVHEWSNQFGDDWTPQVGTPCDCRQRTWGQISDTKPAPHEAATPARMFSIQGGPDIPWSVIAPFDKQCQRNHGGQTLEDLHRRGGLGVSEALAVLHAEDYDKRYPMSKPYPSKETLILELVALVKERQASAEAAPVERPEGRAPVVVTRPMDLPRELRAYLDGLVITSDNIGNIRRRMFMPWESLWNGLVRDETAKRENKLPALPPSTERR